MWFLGTVSFCHWAGASNLFIDDARCVGEFRTTFRTIPAFVAQWIEQRFPKPQVAGPIPAEGARTVWVSVECHMPQAARTYDGRSEILGTADTVCE